ncbi:hypothetical protein EDC96DRAFT_478627 [Choanephora cucurbitarum]|nr:hypothetical protein EDC96DRAFT_478627 [Choanephora cucurbitarum]
MATIVEQVQGFFHNCRLNSDRELAFQSALDLVEILISSFCCSRCCFRYLGCSDFSLYLIDEAETHSAICSILETERQKTFEFDDKRTCSACVGSVQFAESFADPVAARIREEDYQVDSSALFCTLPISVLHRDHFLKLHAVNTLLADPKEYTADLIRLWKEMIPRDPKDFFRYVLASKLKEKINFVLDADSPLRMTVVIAHEPSSKEHMFLTQLKRPLLNVRTIRHKKMRMTVGDSRPNIAEALKKLDNDEAKLLTAIPPVLTTERATFESATFLNSPSYIGGRYLKFSREYSQTTWIVRGQKLTENSVSEVFSDIIKKYYRADDTKFCTAGREDANVRMLGTGRPFYFEVVNPRVPRLADSDYQKMEDEINNQPQHKAFVQVRHLSHVKPEHLKIIKEGEETKTKQYRALVWLSEPLTDELVDRINQVGSKAFTIQQKTPVRVFQRRSAAIRPKTIHTSTIARLHPQVDMNSPEARFGVLQLHTQAGTYIKEYVHGDLGRTQPSLATVGQIHSADLLELDVMDVDLVWPPVKENQEEEPLSGRVTPSDVANVNNKRVLS